MYYGNGGGSREESKSGGCHRVTVQERKWEIERARESERECERRLGAALEAGRNGAFLARNPFRQSQNPAGRVTIAVSPRPLQCTPIPSVPIMTGLSYTTTVKARLSGHTKPVSAAWTDVRLRYQTLCNSIINIIIHYYY